VGNKVPENMVAAEERLELLSEATTREADRGTGQKNNRAKRSLITCIDKLITINNLIPCYKNIVDLPPFWPPHQNGPLKNTPKIRNWQPNISTIAGWYIIKIGI
jgi:hypothetical protein